MRRYVLHSLVFTLHQAKINMALVSEGQARSRSAASLTAMER